MRGAPATGRTVIAAASRIRHAALQRARRRDPGHCRPALPRPGWSDRTQRSPPRKPIAPGATRLMELREPGFGRDHPPRPGSEREKQPSGAEPDSDEVEPVEQAPGRRDQQQVVGAVDAAHRLRVEHAGPAEPEDTDRHDITAGHDDPVRPPLDASRRIAQQRDGPPVPARPANNTRPSVNASGISTAGVASSRTNHQMPTRVEQQRASASLPQHDDRGDHRGPAGDQEDRSCPRRYGSRTRVPTTKRPPPGPPVQGRRRRRGVPRAAAW